MPEHTAALPAPQPWPRRVVRQVLVALALGSVVGGVLARMSHQAAWSTLVYSWCIALGCSFAIDGLRRAAAAWVFRHDKAGSAAARAAWPGWAWMSACLVLGTLIGFTAGAELANALTGLRGTNLFSGGHAAAATFLLISLVPGTVATWYFRSQGQLQAAQAQAEAAERQAAETRLKLLESQLEPHMLFNTLANLRALIAVDPERAQDMLDRLIDFLRATLGASRATLHPLSAEFARLSDYLALMQVRMGERLQVELELPLALAATPVPPLLLQPLVENAIKHGLEPKRGGGLVRVQATQDGDELVLCVVDTGVGPTSPAPAGTRFGLHQVRERLATVYGPSASLTLEPGPADTGGTVVTLRWPEAAAHPSP
jgi:two-component sensor histidine kinase